MANRTVQILGQGYGANPAEITVMSSGNTVFSGTVNTVNQPLPALPDLEVSLTNVLCTFEIDRAFTGQMPMSCLVSSGTVIFGQIFSNYVGIQNPVYTQEQLAILIAPTTTQPERVAIYTQVANPPLSQQDIDNLLDPAVPIDQKKAIVTAHNCDIVISSGPDTYGPIDNTDPRSTVSIDGIPQTPDHTEFEGAWWWTINAGSTLSYQMDVDPAVV